MAVWVFSNHGVQMGWWVAKNNNLVWVVYRRCRILILGRHRLGVIGVQYHGVTLI